MNVSPRIPRSSKPRIRFLRNEFWECRGYCLMGFGYTMEEAYFDWWRKATRLQQYPPLAQLPKVWP